MSDNLKGKTRDELILLLRDAKKELLNLRFRKASGEVTDSSVFRKTRTEIARISTQISALRKKAA